MQNPNKKENTRVNARTQKIMDRSVVHNLLTHSQLYIRVQTYHLYTEVFI